MPISKKEVTKNINLGEIDPSFKKMSSEKKERLKRLVGDYVVEQVQEYLDGSTSPVSGGKFKKFKKDGGPSVLFETGNLRSDISYESVPGGIKVGVFDQDNAPIAYNHNVGDTLPTRQFIPEKDQGFKKKIVDGIKRILKNAD